MVRASDDWEDPVSRAGGIDELIAELPLEQKVAQLGSYGPTQLFSDGELDDDQVADLLGDGVGELTRVGGESDIPPTEAARVTNELQSHLLETAAGIPAIPHEECLSGYMGMGGTTYPQALGLAATWSPSLVEEITTEIRSQLNAIGTAHALSPVLDLARDLRWGRVEETFGEDQYLVARMACAYVDGLQGEDLSSGIAATLKHFVGHGAGAGGKNRSSVDLAPRALAEHLFPFEAAVSEADAQGVMNAYHDLDGMPCGADESLLTDRLRGEWGFDGIVVADYYSVRFLQEEHGIAASDREAAALAVQAGIDVELPLFECYWDLVDAVEDGEVAEETIDTAVRRVLEQKRRLGLFEDPFVDPEAVDDAFETEDQRALARRAGRESVTLLQNEGEVLPLDPDADVAVVGPKADVTGELLGDYAYLAHEPDREEGGIDIVSPLEGVQARASGTVTHAEGCSLTGPSTDGFDEAVETVAEADVALAFVGARSVVEFETSPDEVQTRASTSGEGRDVTDLDLPGVQPAFVETIAETDTPVAVVVVSGKPHAMPSVVEAVPAVAHAWLPGEEGGNAIADVVFGDHSPSGRLPVSMPRNVGQLPVHYSRKPNTANEAHVYTPSDPLFPFGHGESYTEFAYGDVSLAAESVGTAGTIEAEVTVENVGDRAGHEVVQWYAHERHPPRVRPVQELVAFERVHLEPGESATVTVEVGTSQLAHLDGDMDLTVTPGEFELRVGHSATDVRSEATVELVGDEWTVPRSGRRFFSATSVR